MNVDHVDEAPKEIVGSVIVQSRPMTYAESATWIKFLSEFAPDDFFQYVTWVPDQPVN